MLRLAVKLVLLCLAMVRGDLYEGDACTASGGVEGVCYKLSRCPPLMSQIKRGVRPVHCGYDRFDPVVCCPRSMLFTTPPPTTTTPPPTTTTPPPTTTTPPPTSTTTTSPTTPVTIVTTESELNARTVPNNITNGKSAKMCSEYGRYVFWEVPDPTLLVTEKERMYNQSTCVQIAETLIVGGEKAIPMEFPHMVALGYGEPNYITWQCGGSLISDRFVLTAGHCIEARGSGKVRWARLGDLNLYSTADNSDAMTMEVEKAIKHQEYRPPAHYNDIALLKLKDKVTFTPAIRPACLSSSPVESLTPPVTTVTASGWGKDDAMNIEGTEELMRVNLKLLPHSECTSTLRMLVGTSRLAQGIDRQSMICSGELSKNKDTCQGDSGGPLQVSLDSPYCMHSIIGVTSFGSLGCGIGRSASVYTRVSNYIGWIESHVWP